MWRLHFCLFAAVACKCTTLAWLSCHRKEPCTVGSPDRSGPLVIHKSSSLSSPGPGQPQATAYAACQSAGDQSGICSKQTSQLSHHAWIFSEDRDKFGLGWLNEVMTTMWSSFCVVRRVCRFCTTALPSSSRKPLPSLSMNSLFIMTSAKHLWYGTPGIQQTMKMKSLGSWKCFLSCQLTAVNNEAQPFLLQAHA